MKKTNKVSKIPLLGFAVIAAIVFSTALLMTGCPPDDGGTNGDPTTPPEVAHYPLINLTAVKWGDAGGSGEHWTSNNQIKLSDFTTVKPQQGDKLKFKISGNASEQIKNGEIELFQMQGNDWSTLRWLGNSPIGELQNPFEDCIIESTVLVAPVSNMVIYVDFMNKLWQKDSSGNYTYNSGETLPPGKKDGDVMATISNFSISLVVDMAKKITVTGITEKTGNAFINVYNDEGNPVAWGEENISGNSVTFNLFTIVLETDNEGVTYYVQTEEPWTGSGAYYLMIYFPNDNYSVYNYTNGETTPQKYTISSTTSTIAFNKFGYEPPVGPPAPPPPPPDPTAEQLAPFGLTVAQFNQIKSVTGGSWHVYFDLSSMYMNSDNRRSNEDFSNLVDFVDTLFGLFSEEEYEETSVYMRNDNYYIEITFYSEGQLSLYISILDDF